MIDFILRYWVEALFGVCLLLIGYIYKLVKKDIKEYFTKEAKVLIEQERNIYQTDIKALKEKDKDFNNSLHGLKDDMYSLKRGLLSI